MHFAVIVIYISPFSGAAVLIRRSLKYFSAPIIASGVVRPMPQRLVYFICSAESSMWSQLTVSPRPSTASRRHSASRIDPVRQGVQAPHEFSRASA
ncbi:unknown [Sutterella sp. CAG:351]|nr:unknown [Sutterella sp. CAG:351]